MVYKSVQDLQDQIDSLAEVVLQNRRGLDLLTTDKGGICLALQERCCFYANKSGVVRDRIKQHQEELIKRQHELLNQPIWTAWGGILPYLLPLRVPLVGLLLLISFGPWAFNRLTRFVKSQVDSTLKPAEIHYHRLMIEEVLDDHTCIPQLTEEARDISGGRSALLNTPSGRRPGSSLPSPRDFAQVQLLTGGPGDISGQRLASLELSSAGPRAESSPSSPLPFSHSSLRFIMPPSPGPGWKFWKNF